MILYLVLKRKQRQILMNINLNDCTYHQQSQPVWVSEPAKADHNVQKDSLDVILNSSNSVNLSKFSPLSVSTPKTVKINVGENELNMEVKGDKVDETIFDGLDKSLVTSVVIPEGIITIGRNTFKFCKSLKMVTLPKDLRTIEKGAFGFCCNLEDIELPNNLTSIGEYAFEDCIKLIKVNLPGNLNIIKRWAFCGCKGLKEIEVPKRTEVIEESAFYGCGGLTKATFLNTPKSIAEYMFCNCVNLKDIKIPHGVEAIGEGAFSGCYKLSEMVFPNTIKVINAAAFRNCRSLKTIEIPEKVGTIKQGTFRDCYNLERVSFPSNLEAIEHDAFNECRRLKAIEIPERIKVIDSSVFYGCDNLERIDVKCSPLDIISNINFAKCKSLKEISLPVSAFRVTFQDCRSLQVIKINKSMRFPSGRLVTFFNIKIYQSLLSNGSFVFYCNDRDLETTEGLCKQFFPESNIKICHMDGSLHITNRLDWSWKF